MNSALGHDHQKGTTTMTRTALAPTFTYQHSLATVATLTTNLTDRRAAALDLAGKVKAWAGLTLTNGEAAELLATVEAGMQPATCAAFVQRGGKGGACGEPSHAICDDRNVPVCRAHYCETIVERLSRAVANDPYTITLARAILVPKSPFALQ